MRLTRVGFVAALLSSAAVGLVAAPPGAVHADTPGATSGSARSIACPVAGESTYDDSYGWARSGGRRHKGIDMVAERGTPVAAARDGEVTFKNSRLGGKSAWLYTADGAKFFYAHLNDWEGESRTVEAGEVIGYVGSTGNAGGPHLHFESHYSGSTENPYPAVVEACSKDAAAERTPVPAEPYAARWR